jgi:hypothetical protein
LDPLLLYTTFVTLLKRFEYAMARVEPGHHCGGPDSNCDGDCVDAARDSELLAIAKDVAKQLAGGDAKT